MEGVSHMVKICGVKLSQWNREHFENVQRNVVAAQNRLQLAQNFDLELIHPEDISKVGRK